MFTIKKIENTFSEISNKMRYNITINNTKALEFDLNIKQAYLFAWIYELPSWAKMIHHAGQNWYFASRFKAVNELPLLTDKPDTMYRHYKALEDKGLIMLTKIVDKDYVLLTTLGKSWNKVSETHCIKEFDMLGNFSEHSEKNPSELGKKSEESSEKFPTYNNISNINNKISNKYIYTPDQNSVFEKKLFLSKEDPFLKKICKSFDQNLEVLEMRVWSFLNSLKEKNKLGDFQIQTEAYLEYKMLTKEISHRWTSFVTEWDAENWCAKLAKHKENEKKPTAKTSGRYKQFSKKN